MAYSEREHDKKELLWKKIFAMKKERAKTLKLGKRKFSGAFASFGRCYRTCHRCFLAFGGKTFWLSILNIYNNSTTLSLFSWGRRRRRREKENDLLHFPHALLSLIKKEETKNLAPPHLFNSSLSLSLSGKEKCWRRRGLHFIYSKSFFPPPFFSLFSSFLGGDPEPSKKFGERKGAAVI